ADTHYLICMTPCDHPFKPGVKLDNLFYKDDYGYCWDGHTWKYVLKYGLTLPEEFIAHVMSEEGTAYINQCIDQNPNWSDAMKKWKKEHQGYLCLMPTREEIKKLEYF
ncbi:MAG: hypothetical protein IIV90_03260, partial [Oscillospiraceae bacterium]|nr:hypothetical protein [Oscillospiraceae bacterium]